MLEKLLLRKFYKIIRKMSLVVSFLKNSNCPIHLSITIGKLTPPQLFPLSVSTILKFDFSVEKSNTCMVRKVALLEILKSSLLTGVQAYSIEFVRF